MSPAALSAAEAAEKTGRRGSALKYTGVACVGFCVDWLVLHAGVALGLPAWGARIVSLTSAMQVTFVLNRLFVFKCLERESLPSQWLVYMATNAVGNVCNYFAFNGLLSLHRPVVSDHTFALAVGGVVAWAVNYMSARHLVFARGPDTLLSKLAGRLGVRPLTPSPAAEPACHTPLISETS